MASIATAGKILTETDLRTFIHCSQLWHYGGSFHTEPLLLIVQYCYERLLSNYLRKTQWDPLMLITKFALAAVKEYNLDKLYLPQQITELVRTSTLVLNEVLQYFPLDKYILVYGAFNYRIRVSKTPVDLQVSALYRSLRNQTLHIVCFTPYKNEHAALNDPSIHLKLQTLKHVVKPHASSGRVQAKVHLFGLNSESSLMYYNLDTAIVNSQQLKLVEQLVIAMEMGFHYPVLPCVHSCPFKRKCLPTGD